MKTIIIESTAPLSWYFIADSALVNTGKPFFLPEFADEFEVFLTPVVRISRIGKSIGSRFAGRYYSEIAPAVHFRASALRRRLAAAGLPTDPSHSFDRSMTVGEFLPVDTLPTAASFRLTIGGEIVAECSVSDVLQSVGPLLEAVSAANTIKMGDYLVPVISGGRRIRIGDTVEVELDGRPLITIHIK